MALLLHDGCVRRSLLLHRVHPRTDDHNDAIEHLFTTGQQVAQHGAAGDLVQWLGQRGLHTSPDTGGQNYRCMCHRVPRYLIVILTAQATPCQSLSLSWRSKPVSECNIVTRTLLLDLDGTLVNSVPDLAAALNRLMAARGLAPLTAAETAPMVGDGVVKLVERAFAARG